MRRALRGLMSLGFVASLLLPIRGVARAEDYVLGPDDVVAISVWLHPELERTVTVNSGGSIVFPPVGEITAAGLTPKQLGDRLADRITAYLRQAATVTVTVKDFLSHSVYVSGAVAKPGRIGFEHIPSIVDVITAAGGALTTADLSRVQVVRQDGNQRHTLVADVASVIHDGSVENLPKLQPGDMVMVPALLGANAAGSSEGASVLGEVARPGIYPASAGVDLWALLASAGGFTARANLHHVRIMTRQGDAASVTEVNLSDMLQRAPRASIVVKPGDVVMVPATGGSPATFFTQTLQLAIAALNVAVLVDVLKRGHY